jgi:hypothetical protein
MRLFKRLERSRRSASATHPAPASTDPAVEVIVLWGDALQHPEQTADVLHVAQLGDDDGFAVGDATEPGRTVLEGTRLATDYLIDRAQLGVERLPVVVRGAYGDDGKRMPLLVVAQGACVRAFGDDGRVRDAAQLIVDNELCSSGDHAFPYAWPIAAGSTLWLSYRGFTFVVRIAVPVEAVATRGIADWNGQRYAAVSFAAHVFLLALFYYSPPRSSAMSNDLSMSDPRYLDYVLKVDEYVEPDLPELIEDGASGEAAAQGEQGTYGEPKAQQKVAKTTTRTAGGPNEPTREELKEMASKAGILGVLASAAPVADGLFTGAAAGGTDSYAALASLFGTIDGPSWGSKGLGPSGVGRGGGGDALGTIGAGPLGTIGDPGAGAGRGKYGTGVGNLTKRDPRVPPRVKSGTPDIFGSLSKETIRRVIQRRLNEVRFCYEQGLQARPDLQGRVAVRFIIGPTGVVQRAAVASSDVADAKVQKCITDAVGRMTFPAPEGSGIVSVTYPFVLEQVGG